MESDQVTQRTSEGQRKRESVPEALESSKTMLTMWPRQKKTETYTAAAERQAKNPWLHKARDLDRRSRRVSKPRREVRV